jgi:hypothetical protein
MTRNADIGCFTKPSLDTDDIAHHRNQGRGHDDAHDPVTTAEVVASPTADALRPH